MKSNFLDARDGKLMIEELKSGLLAAYQQKFNENPEWMAFSPGRVNLIGEHIDYSGGHVLPCALNMGNLGALGPRDDGRLAFYSLNYAGIGVIEIDREPLLLDMRDHWSNYPKAMLSSLEKLGFDLESGFNLAIYGNIPSGAGLSSSASVAVLTGVLLRAYYGFELSQVDLALAAQRAENEFIGLNCGIMDQYAVACSEENRALLLNTGSLEAISVPLNFAEYELLICSSNKRRGLAGSAYNERRASCEEALADLRRVRPELTCLCELRPEEFNELESAIKDPIAKRRARHAVAEEARTLAAYEALNQGDVMRFGQLMTASHLSLRDDYEVSCREVDILVESALAEEACAGSRMTGGGFGGCTVSLIKASEVEEVVARMAESYYRETWKKAEFYLVGAAPGARMIDV